MNPALPPRLKALADALLEGISRKELAPRAQAISAHYRAGAGSISAIASQDDALAYVVARLPATYAAAAAVLEDVRSSAVGFSPASLLDVGAGPATASWAARETWESLTQLTLTDANAHFLALARRLAPASDAQFLVRDVLRDGLPNADLVIASYVLAEIAPAAQSGVVAKLFAAAIEVLVLIEPGTPAGFERLRAARALLILEGAQILGPCTHAAVCPIAAPDWCHFSQRLPRSRDHLQTKSARVPFEDERYAWLAVGRTRRAMSDGNARLLAPPRETKAEIALKLCGAQGLENRVVPRRDKAAFASARKARWGDAI